MSDFLNATQPDGVVTRFLRLSILLGAIYVVVTRLILSVHLPLWLDETWTGMIVATPGWTAFWREAWLDCNPPLYYLFLRCWTLIFGDSNFMLRLPTFLFIIAAALLPLVWRPRGLKPNTAWIFAALIILWTPGLHVMINARSYGLMILLSTASCLVVARLMDRLTWQYGAMWVGLGTAMFLTHYYAAVLVIGQGAVLFYRHRLDLFRLWPTMIVALPGFIWFAFHALRLRDYARPDVVWYDPLTVKSAFAYLGYMFGVASVFSFAGLAFFVLIVVKDKYWRPSNGTPVASEAATTPSVVRYLALTAGAGLIGYCVAIVVGLFQPSLTDRYFIPLVPPAMLGIALMTQVALWGELAGLILAFSFLLSGMNSYLTKAMLEGRAFYGYEEASDFVQLHHPDQLLFLWDHPGTKIMDSASLRGIGGYFMERAGYHVAVKPMVVPLHADANALLHQAADGKRPAFIWLYDKIRRSAALEHPPAFAKDPAWICRTQARPTMPYGEVGTIACVKRGGEHD